MYNYCPKCGEATGNEKDDFKCVKCENSFYANSRPTGTVIPVFNNEILVGVRGEEPNKGKYDFLGGFLHNGEDPLVGSVREFLEETGMVINPEDLEYIGVWIGDYEYQGDILKTFNMTYLLRVDEKISVRAADDVVDFKWISLAEETPMAFEFQNEIFKTIQKNYG